MKLNNETAQATDKFDLTSEDLQRKFDSVLIVLERIEDKLDSINNKLE